MTHPPTIKQLRYLVAPEKHLHFGQAAEACFVTQAAFSLAIKELESLLGLALVDRNAHHIMLTEAGLRVLGANYQQSEKGVFTDKIGTLSNDFFVHLLDMNIIWEPCSDDEEDFVGKDRNSQQVKWTASRFDLVFGSNSQLRAIAEYYACDDANQRFIHDFVRAWTKVMNLDRFDIH